MGGRGLAAGASDGGACCAIESVAAVQREKISQRLTRIRPMLHYKPAVRQELRRGRGSASGIIEMWVKLGTSIQQI